MEPNLAVARQNDYLRLVKTDDTVIFGRIVGGDEESVQVNTDMRDLSQVETFKQEEIQEISPAEGSMMPEGLLNTFNQVEILDLMAYILSGGDRDDLVFQH